MRRSMAANIADYIADGDAKAKAMAMAMAMVIVMAYSCMILRPSEKRVATAWSGSKSIMYK